MTMRTALATAFLGCLALCGQRGLAADAPPERWLPLDADGWTVLAPAADSRLIYVSSRTGDDATGRPLAPGDPAVGDDPCRPKGPLQAFKTIAAAKAHARTGHPDWLLLERGNVWDEPLGSLPSGRAAAEPLVVTSYGASATRPLLRTADASAVQLMRRPDKNRIPHDIAIVGLHFYGYKHDPKSPDYAGTGSRGRWLLLGGLRLLVEDCRMEFLGLMPNGEQLAVRRCLILNNYSNHSHSQGSYAHHTSVLLEENVYDHNGWWKPGLNNRKLGGGATMFNHNTYFTDCHHVAFRGNVFLRASSIGNKWTSNSGPASAHHLVIDDNLYVEGEIGISMGGNKTGPLRFKDVRITNNVFLHIGRGRPTQRALGWYLDATDWDGGLIASNLFAHQTTDAVRNVYGLHLGSSTSKGKYAGNGVHCRKVAIRNNVFYGLKNASAAIIIGQGHLLDQVVFTGNRVQLPGLRAPILRCDGRFESLTFRGNTYHTGADAGRWFTIGREPCGFDAWAEKSGETGSSCTRLEFPDAKRTLETYLASLGTEATFETFIAEVRKQSKAAWRPKLTAPAINAYFREGFGVKKAEQPTTP